MAPPAGIALTRSHQWFVLVAMTGSLSMVLLDQTVVTVALPTMQKALPLSAGGAHWVVSGYVLAMAAFVALAGRIGDRFGGVTTFRIGVVLFFLASAGCGLVPHGGASEWVLISFRAVQGIGAALMLPASEAIVTNTFSLADRGRAMAVYVGVGQIFLAIGPLLGGFLTEWVSWRAAFWLNVPVGILALFLVTWAKPPNVGGLPFRPSPVLVIAIVGGMAALIFGIQEGPGFGWRSPITISTIVVGLAAIAWVVRDQMAASDPLIDVRQFLKPGVGGDLLVVSLIQFALLGMVLYATIYLQNVLGFSPMNAGIAALPFIFAIAGGAQVGGRWFDRSGVRDCVLAGLTLAAAGTAAWALVLPVLNYWLMVPAMLVTGFGIGLVQSPTNTDVLSRATPAERTQTSGLVQTVRQVGGATGVAVIGAIVLTITPGGARAAPDAWAITAGFGAGAVALLLALAGAWRLLPSGRIGDAPVLPSGG